MKVELINTMGDDLTVVNAARVSFDKESDWEWEKFPAAPHHEGEIMMSSTLSEKDKKLIKYLASHNHWTPYSHVMITMRETVPIFVARQRFKHMVGFTYNEVSRRYVDDEPEFYVPDKWRKRAENKKQGSSDEVIEFFGNHYQWDGYEDFNPVDSISEAYNYLIKHVEFLYTEMLKAGVAPEQARMVLPQSMYTSYYVTGSLAAWARAYKLRIDPHAQKEIQDLAKMWDDVISNIKVLEYSWKVLTE